MRVIEVVYGALRRRCVENVRKVKKAPATEPLPVVFDDVALSVNSIHLTYQAPPHDLIDRVPVHILDTFVGPLRRSKLESYPGVLELHAPLPAAPG
jgi:hypothetical protein